MRGLATVLSASILGLPAFAEVPRVAVDIPPVHALVAQVMGDIGAPDLVVPPGASPHDYALRPSEAGLLQSADLVVWVGSELAPWLSDPIETLAGEAHHLTLLEAEGIRRLSFREGATFEAHDHGDHAGHDHEGEHDHEDEHGHDDHDHDHDHDEHAHDDHGHGDDHSHDDDHGHEDDHTHEAHADEHEHEAHEDHGHDHGHAHSHDGVDPHAWLDPANAAVWLNVIAEELSEIDPDNADVYRANAEAAAAELDTLSDTVAMRMSTLDGGFIVFHDAYHYFEARFGIEATGAISLSDATPPSPARMAEIRDLVAAAGVSCVFVEPQFNPGVVEAVFAESEARIVEIDPLGAQLTPGPELYEALLLDMAASFEACLQP